MTPRVMSTVALRFRALSRKFLSTMSQYINLHFSSLMTSTSHLETSVSGFCFWQGKVLTLFSFWTINWISIECQELTHVRICRFNLSVPPSFCGFKNLLYLHVERITFESGALENLISSSSSLEELYIVRCFGYKCIDLSSSTLKVFQIEYGHAIKSFCLEKAKNLTDFTLIVYYRNGVSSLTKIFPKI